MAMMPMTEKHVDMAATGTQIRLEHIVKDFGLTAPVVNDVSLTVEPGEFLTLLGPSGSGKTTTLNLIAGFETLTAGSIFLNSADVSGLPSHKRNLGMLFQDYALFPHMTVAQNVAYPLRERKVPKGEIAARVREVLQLVQLTGRDNTYPRQLSGGQQQRVALARAIVFNPRALLLDEPLSALDRGLRASMQQEIRRIHKEVGATFIFVTHDQEEAMNLSDRIALFNEGSIVQVGTPEQLYLEPDTLFAARFLGDSNVFDLGESTGAPTAFVEWESERWKVAEGSSAPVAQGGRQALVVRPEVVEVCRDRGSVPSGHNMAPARVLDTQYLGSYRTLLLSFGGQQVPGRVRVNAGNRDYSVDDDVIAWWPPAAQRVVAA